MLESAKEHHISENGKDAALSKLRFGSIKQNDLKTVNSVLMIPCDNRTVSDLNSLVTILMHIEPVKKLQNVASVYFMSREMSLHNYKSKSFIFENSDQSESLYIVLHGKIAFYRKSDEFFDIDEVVYLPPGSCFGELYEWKTKFAAIAVTEIVIACLSKKSIKKIPLQIAYDRHRMIEEIKNSEIFQNFEPSNPGFQEAVSFFTLNKLPYHTYLIRAGQLPKALFFISKGIVKKVFSSESQQIEVKRYARGQSCPRSFKQPLKYDLITESVCEIITIPLKALKSLNSRRLEEEPEKQNYISLCHELQKRQLWKSYKQTMIKDVKACQQKPDRLNATKSKSRTTLRLFKH